tara:strand:+ start:826 stop:1098 length:273 start_codon:yes stop_codon:yes gene_type:complete
MGKKEKVVDLKQRPDKVSKEHLAEMQKIVNRINGIQFNVGKIEAQKHGLLHELAVAHDQAAVLQDDLQNTYGSHDIDLKSGNINWPKDEK